MLHPLLQSLNDEQCAAVSAPPGNLLILAGAGSGKTRVLVHRIAWLIEHYHLSPHSILAVTFTNKAAHEMRGRIESLLNHSVSHLWVGTFHGLSHRLLRTHWRQAGLEESFQIIDADDQLRLVKRLMRQFEIDETKWPPKQVVWFINKEKEAGRRPHQSLDFQSSYFTEVMVRIYRAYEEVCQRSSLVDFAELLLRSVELLQKNPEVAEHYRSRFQHILVDEFQDTNQLQYIWLKQFSTPQNYFIAVGDDDQSIYSWRGACVENIQRFSTEFPNVSTIRLEQNYRSTQTILNAANAVITHNTNRMGKNLWSQGHAGTPISLYPAFNERDEAYFIASKIQNWLDQGNRATDVAILYRSNAQSRVLEEQLIDKQIPYRIYGGVKFYERAEIKDAIAYLRLIINRSDDASFERIINTPTRGVGDSTLSVLRSLAREQSYSLWQSATMTLSQGQLPTRAANALANFIRLIETIASEVDALSLGEAVTTMLDLSGLRLFFEKDKSEKGLARVENLDELINATSEFKVSDDSLPPLQQFLAQVSLETGDEQSKSHGDCVNLMTLHSAKGLEFKLVIIAGMEEELFPHKMSLDEAHGLEEERRLCYVGITRAMEKLILTYAECRRLHGIEKYCQPSRFIAEIPEELLCSERPRAKVSRSSEYSRQRDTSIDSEYGFSIGQRVRHAKFGAGTIINYEGQGEHLRLQVKFDQVGSKWLVANFARLEQE